MKRGTPDHPKTHTLAALLDLPQYTAVGILESLWHFAQKYALAGDVGRYTDEAISRAIGWTGNAADLVSALVKSGWVDRCTCHRARVHDWPEHCDQYVRKSVKGLFLECYQKDVCKDVAEPLQGPCKPSAPGLDRLGKDLERHGTEGAPFGRKNPLMDRPKAEGEALALVREISAAENLDGTEVIRAASDWKGKGYVNPATMSDDRLAHTLSNLRARAARMRAPPADENSHMTTAQRRALEGS